MTLLSRSVVTLASAAITMSCAAQVTLMGDDPPTDPLWKKPATIAYTHGGNGQSTATVDGVLRYKGLGPATRTAWGPMQFDYNVALYAHRNTSDKTPKNDRGLSISAGEALVPFSESEAVTRVYLTSKASVGRALAEVKDAAGNKTYRDKDKDRVVLRLGGYFQPGKPKSETPPKLAPDGTLLPQQNTSRSVDMFFDGHVGLYSDNSRGGDGVGNGRVNGSLALLSANIAPFGLDPALNRPFGSLGFVPTFTVSAQWQKDSSASGGRTKESRRLYSAGVTLSFAKLDEKATQLVPSLSLSRSVGADLLVGRAHSAKTELTFGLSF